MSKRRHVTHRAFVGWICLGAACSRASPPAPPKPAETLEVHPAATHEEISVLEWKFENANERAIVLVPASTNSTGRFPVLLALHGRGEALKGPERGVWGWPRDYELVRAIQRVRTPPLTSDDYFGFVEPSELDAANRTLRDHPYLGMIVVCAYLPDVNLSSSAELDPVVRFLTGPLLERVRRETPASDALGIDGVSLGGTIALYTGLSRADLFRTVGALQPAIVEGDAATWVERATRARAKNPNLQIRLTTSTEDGFRPAVEHLAQAFQNGHIAHELHVLPGPHDYVFNRGPGAYEMLLWNERALRR